MTSRSAGREHNEDACLIRDYSLRRKPRYLCLMAVADGMGGHNAGDVASQAAIELLENLAGSHRFSDAQYFEENVEKAIWGAFSTINSHINDLGLTSPERAGMGTTLTCALIDDRIAYVGHVGDSRAYLVSSDGIHQITADHSVVGQMLSEGVLTEREAQVHEKRNVLTRAIGPESNVEIDIMKAPVLPGEIIFMCTDGLYTVVDSEEIREVLLTEGDLQTACERLADLAMARGTDDNVTAVAWRMPQVDAVALPASGARRRTVHKKKRGTIAAWKIAVAAVVLLLAGLAIGWGIGAFRNREGEDRKTQGPAERSSGEEQGQDTGIVTTGPAESEKTGAGYSKGDTVVIDCVDPGSTYILRTKPDTASLGAAVLRDGDELEVVSGPRLDESGKEWYQVRVVQNGASRDKMGYVRSDYLKPAKKQEG